MNALMFGTALAMFGICLLVCSHLLWVNKKAKDPEWRRRWHIENDWRDK